MNFRGVLDDGSVARPNSDKARLDFIDRCEPIVKITKRGIITIGVTMWQPSLRAAIDVAIEVARRRTEA